MKSQESILNLIEKLFDEKLDNLKCDVADIKKAIYGNGKPGLLDRVDNVEDIQKNLLGKMGAMTVFFGLIFTGMFEIAKGFISKKLGL